MFPKGYPQQNNFSVANFRIICKYRWIRKYVDFENMSQSRVTVSFWFVTILMLHQLFILKKFTFQVRRKKGIQ